MTDDIAILISLLPFEINIPEGFDWTPVPPFEDHELAIAETLWRGGRLRRQRAIVERLLAYRNSTR